MRWTLFDQRTSGMDLGALKALKGEALNDVCCSA